MQIINPIYDQAFKYMMDNEGIAKKVLSIILGQQVLSIQSKPQETKSIDKKRDIPLSRFDFKAIIQDDEGKQVNVLIELQKSNRPDPIVRFRRYLGKNYIRKETFINPQGIEETRVLPIITIYLLGYKLAEYDTPAILVNNTVIDTVNNVQIDLKNEFVQLLTHPSYILQIERLRPERRTRIEKFLSIFDQGKRTDEDYILDIGEEEDEEDMKAIKNHLNRATQDEEMIRVLELEEDIDQEFEKLEATLELAKQGEEEALRQKEEALRQKEEALRQKKEEREQKEEALKQKEDALRQKEEAQKRESEALMAIKNMVKQLADRNMGIPEIARMLGRKEQEIEDMLKG
jgi:hypothetical protein